MNEEQLSSYFEKFGDRIAVKAFCRMQLEMQENAGNDTDTVIDKLNKKIGSKHKTVGKDYSPSRSNKYRRMGNSNGMKCTRKVEIGWLHCVSKSKQDAGYCQVRAKCGGGVRHLQCDKNTNMEELKKIASDLFFPEGKSKKGNLDDFAKEMMDFSQKRLPGTETIGHLYDTQKMKTLRLYLATRTKSEDPVDMHLNDDDSLPNIPVPVLHSSPVDKCENTSHDDSTQQLNKGRDPVDMHLNDDDSLPNIPVPVLHSSPVDKCENTSYDDSTQQLNKGRDPVDMHLNDDDSLPNIPVPVLHSSPVDKCENTSHDDSTQQLNKGRDPVDMHLNDDDSLPNIPVPVLQSSPVDKCENTSHDDSTQQLNKGRDETPISNDHPLAHSVSVDKTYTLPSILEQNQECFVSSEINDRDAVHIVYDLYDFDDTVQFGTLSPSTTDLNSTIPLIKQIKLHRGQVFTELLAYMLSGDINENTEVGVSMILPNGREEVAEDSGGVLRDALSEFWGTFRDKCTLGNSVRVPALRHDMQYEHWKATAQILVMGFKQTGYLPVYLAIPFVAVCLQVDQEHLCNQENLVSAFLNYIPESDKEILQMATRDLSEVDQDELLDIMASHDVKVLLKQDNIKDVIAEIAHKSLIQSPAYIADAWRDVLPRALKPLKTTLNELFASRVPTARNVLKHLSFPSGCTPSQATIANFLRKFVKLSTQKQLVDFLRFCTGVFVIFIFD